MEPAEEYHDPDYPGASVTVTEEPKTLDEVDKVQKIKNIIRREFANEIEARENEIRLIDQRVSSARHLLHRLRCALVTRYYQEQKLQLSAVQVQDEVSAQHEPRSKAEVSSLLRAGQRRLHPSVRKLLGARGDLQEIMGLRTPRAGTRKDYSAMVQTRNYTIAADKTTTLRPKREGPTEGPPEGPTEGPPRKVPRRLDPKVENVVTLDEVTRNRQKHRFRIIIGNTSKYAPAASAADASTHKWLLYVRHADNGNSQQQSTHDSKEPLVCGGVVTAVSAELHHSYAPHHRVHVDKPPFHISRRGWGEFPAKVTLHFVLPERNKPATVEHTVKLDRNYTGLQTLGAETIVDVWLYSNEEMLKYEFKDASLPAEVATACPEPPVDVKVEPMDAQPSLDLGDPGMQVDNWLDFFKNESTELDVDEMIIKAVKKENIEELCPTIQNDTLNPLDTSEIGLERAVKLEKDLEIDLRGVKIEKHLADIDGVAEIKSEINETEICVPDTPTTPKKRIMKYIDPNTGKIYYLEMDRTLDLSKVQEIVINSKGNTKSAKISPIKANGQRTPRKPPKKGISLLKPELNNYLKAKEPVKPKNYFKHIENDHCYLGQGWAKKVFSNEEPVLPVETKNLPEVVENVDAVMVENHVDAYEKLCDDVKRLSCVRVAVNYLLSKIPLVCEVKDSDKTKCYPFTVESDSVYWNLDFAKRRNIEWSRAKLINNILSQHSNLTSIWRTKQILLFSRLHGYYPIRDSKNNILDNDEWLNETGNSRQIDLKELYSRNNGLSIFNPKDFPISSDVRDAIDLTEQEEEVEVVYDSPVKVKREVLPEPNLTVLPVESEEDRLRFMFIERKCADIGIELRNEDVGNGYSYSAVHAVLLTAMKKFAEEILRTSREAKLTENRTADDPPMSVWNSPQAPVHVGCTSISAATTRQRLSLLSAEHLGAEKQNHDYS